MISDIFDFLKERISYVQAQRHAAYQDRDRKLEAMLYGYERAYEDVHCFLKKQLEKGVVDDLNLFK